MWLFTHGTLCLLMMPSLAYVKASRELRLCIKSSESWTMIACLLPDLCIARHIATYICYYCLCFGPPHRSICAVRYSWTMIACLLSDLCIARLNATYICYYCLCFGPPHRSICAVRYSWTIIACLLSGLCIARLNATYI